MPTPIITVWMKIIFFGQQNRQDGEGGTIWNLSIRMRKAILYRREIPSGTLRANTMGAARSTGGCGWKENGACYQMFQTVTARNDLGEDDPYSHWEDFKHEAETCARKVCGDRVSDLSFARYRVTDLCDMCYYQFVFDGCSKKYLIMAAFACTDGALPDLSLMPNAVYVSVCHEILYWDCEGRRRR